MESGSNAKNLKAQGAMEYLMTYGWSILIVAIILGILFQLGVFSGANSTGTSCVASSSYLCQTPILTNTGALTFVFGTTGSKTIYNVQLACAATSTSAGLPNPITAFNSLTYNAQTNTATPVVSSQTGNALTAGQTITVQGLPCYGGNGQALGSVSLGTSFSGKVWINYTTSVAAENPNTNPWLTDRAVTLRITVS